MLSHHSHDVSAALAILLLKNHQNEAEYIHLLVIFHPKTFPIGLKENFREEDNLSTKDNWPFPKVSFVQRFYCIMNVSTISSQVIDEDCHL